MQEEISSSARSGLNISNKNEQAEKCQSPLKAVLMPPIAEGHVQKAQQITPIWSKSIDLQVSMEQRLDLECHQKPLKTRMPEAIKTAWI